MNIIRKKADLPSEIVMSVLRENIERILHTKTYKFDVGLLAQLGENNFIGLIYRVSFTALDNNKQVKGSIHNLIVKVGPQNIEYRDAWFVRPCFLREIYMYREVNFNQIYKFICYFSYKKKKQIKFNALKIGFAKSSTV